MSYLAASSLFDPGSQPVMGSATEMTSSIISADLAITLCTIAVALVGIAAFSGRLPLARAGKTMIGCFLLLGSPTLAASLLHVSAPKTPERFAIVPEQSPQPPRSEVLPPANIDPYAGAALRKTD